jgi:anti-sigma factor RsiW
MISEQIEFQISQYVDGTLSSAERGAVDQLLADDPQARKLLADYRQLSLQLSKMNAGPSVRWDRLSEHLSAGIDQATAPAVAGRIRRPPSFAIQMRIAAAVLVALTAWIVVRHHSVSDTAVRLPGTPAPVGRIDVQGPQSEIATGPAVEDVQVMPSQTAARNEAPRYGEGVIDHGPPKVVISGLTPAVKKSSGLH